MSVQRLSIVVICLACAAGGAVLQAAIGDADKAALEQELQDVIRVRVETAEKAFNTAQSSFDAEQCIFATLSEAANRFVDAEIEAKPAEEIAARTRHLERTKLIEEKIKKIVDNGGRGAEAKEYFAAMRERQSAEIALLKTRLKTKQ